MEIKYEYPSNLGTIIYNVKNIHFDSIKDFNNNIGPLVFETSNKSRIFLTSKNDLNGSYIYLSKDNHNLAYKVSKSYRFLDKNNDQDPPMIAKLNSLKENITLTDFPKGIITIKDIVIGQEIVYYYNYQTLTSIIYKGLPRNKLLSYYQKILLIIQELLDHNIIYIDIHPNNIMINLSTDEVKLIDFDPHHISFNNDRESYYRMLTNLKKMINEINTYLKIPFIIEDNLSFKDISKKILLKKEG